MENLKQKAKRRVEYLKQKKQKLEDLLKLDFLTVYKEVQEEFIILARDKILTPDQKMCRMKELERLLETTRDKCANRDSSKILSEISMIESEIRNLNFYL